LTEKLEITEQVPPPPPPLPPLLVTPPGVTLALLAAKPVLFGSNKTSANTVLQIGLNIQNHSFRLTGSSFIKKRALER
jgi:hypothetical protein